MTTKAVLTEASRLVSQGYCREGVRNKDGGPAMRIARGDPSPANRSLVPAFYSLDSALITASRAVSSTTPDWAKAHRLVRDELAITTDGMAGLRLWERENGSADMAATALQGALAKC